MNAQTYIDVRQARINQFLQQHLPSEQQEPKRLYQAIRYAVLNGGKRLRPLLVYAAGEALGATLEQLDPIAAAVEMIHAYSLIHDDLPAMDNDDFRRGIPSCHKAFDQATAILAGDTLQVLAFEILSNSIAGINEAQQIQMINSLAKACGAQGMAGGQAMEFAFAPEEIDSAKLELIHCLKTGALMRASVQLGAIAANTSSKQKQQLDQFASYLGLAYQIQDDLQDEHTASSIIPHLGIQHAQEKVQQLTQQALSIIEVFGEQAEPLQWVAGYMINC